MSIYWLQHYCKDENYWDFVSHNQTQELLMMRLEQDFEIKPGKRSTRDS